MFLRPVLASRPQYATVRRPVRTHGVGTRQDRALFLSFESDRRRLRINVDSPLTSTTMIRVELQGGRLDQ